MSLDLYVSACEKSADSLAFCLLEPLEGKLRYGGTLGPELLQLKNIELFFPMEEFQVIGFTQVLFNLRKIYRLFKKVRAKILSCNPKVVLLVDYPEFHLLLAKSLRKHGYQGKIIQTVLPSIWAWRPQRKHSLEKYFDAVLCLFPFEPELFANSPLQAVYIGHPLAKKILDNFSPQEDKDTVALFPGSRRAEILRHLPLQLEAIFAQKISQPVAVCLSHKKHQELVEKILIKKCQNWTQKPHIVFPEDRYSLMQKSTFALAKMGTVNLELALMQVPTITFYTLSSVERYILEHVFKLFLPHYSIVNILLKRRFFPEYVCSFAHAKNLSQEIHNFCQNKNLEPVFQTGFSEIKNLFFQKNPAKIASNYIYDLI